MRIKYTSQLITAVILVASCTSVGTHLYASQLIEQRKATYESLYKSLKAMDLLAEGSDTLTNATKAYAATADQRYEQDFQSELTQRRAREQAVQILTALNTPADEMVLVVQAKEKSDELVRLERRILAAVSNRANSEAIALAFGDEFRRGKAAVMEPLRLVRARTETRLLAQVKDLSERSATATLQAMIVLALSLMLSLGAVMVFFQRRVISPLITLTGSTARMLAGETDVRFDYTDETNEIGDLARSLDDYRRVSLETEQQRWLKTHLADLADALQHGDDTAEFAQTLLARLAPLLSCGAAALYLQEEAGQPYVFCSGWGVDRLTPELSRFEPGQGLVGQAALDGKPLLLPTVPASQLQIASGLGRGDPSMVIVVPLHSSERVLAVLTLATHVAPDARQWTLLNELSNTVASRLAILLRNLRTRQLLQATQQQSEQLQAQAIELQAQAIELQAQQESIKATERWYSALIESAPDGMLVADAEGNIILTNVQLDAMFGYERGELIGQRVERLVPDAAGRGHAVLRAGYHAEGTSRTMGTLDMPLFGLRKDGTQVPVEVGLSLLPEFEQRGRCVCAAVRDVTDKRQRDQDIRKARDLAEDATRMKSDFLANMSHEIRTPMNAIVGLSHLALKTELTPRQRSYLQKIQQSSQHLLGLINDILDFSRIEAGRLDIEHTDFVLSAVLDNVANLIHEKAADKGLELVIDVGHDIPDNLVGDPLRLGQILINYSNNAVKFTEHGEINVVVRKQAEEDGRVCLHFAVRDTGIGLSEEQASRLFQSFSQADSSTSRRYGGSGLGLVISKKLVGLMEGEVGLQSELGVGSTFWFTAWFDKSTRPARALMPDPDLRGHRLLVVDDNENARTVLADLATTMTFRVDTAESGARAVAAVREAASAGEPFEVIALDWQMPGMDGLETARQIRALGLTPHPHLLLVTAYGREDVIKSAQEAGLEAILIKPVSASLLYDTLMHTLREAATGLLNLPAADPPEALLAGARTAPALADSEVRSKMAERSVLEAQLSGLAGARILLVEDNEINQQVASELLSDAGFSVDVASHGAQALEQAARTTYDLVLMDMQMPVMDGLTATRELRRRPEGADLPIIAMTANAMPEHREQCLAAGMNDHLAKPIEPDALWRALLQWIPPRSGLGRTDETPGDSHPATPDAVTLELAPHIPGLDTRQGLRRVLGRQALYLNLLAQFASGQADSLTRIDAALAAGDTGAAAQVAHALRGVAGNIGAVEVADAAAQLERALQLPAAAADIARHQQQLALALHPLLAALPTLTAAPPAGPPANPLADAAPAFTNTRLARVNTELALLLAQGDYRVTAVLRHHAEMLRSAYGALFEQMNACVHAFDHDAALDLLRQAARARGLPIKES